MLCLAVMAMAVMCAPVSAQTNSWTSGSGSWDQVSAWSLGILPNGSQSVLITNTGWKAVAINPSTPVSFPDSMTVSNLTIRGATNTENTLLLNYFGTGVPLTVLNGLTVADGGQILDFNSGLVVGGGAFTVTNSQINQDGGLIDTTNATMYLQNAAYNLTNGVFEGGVVEFGLPASAQFNQYGGTVVITNLIFGQGTLGAGGHYVLYGGELSLPSGLTLRGDNNSFSSYFQSGGTNRTTSVFLEPGAFGSSPGFTLNGGLLADSNVSIFADDFGAVTLNQNGGTHVITNAVNILGSTGPDPSEVHPGVYQLSGGTLSAGSVSLSASQGPAAFIQSNGIAQIGEIQANSGGSGNSFFVTGVTLSGGTLNCADLFITDGGNIEQSGGALTVSNTLSVVGFFNPGRTNYTTYEFLGGTLTANNITIGGDWIIGDSSGTNRISNPGTFTLSHTLVISNAVEQLGSFALGSNATIDLAGSASKLSFANSSGASWAGGATLMVADWNGNLSGGGAEQLKFGTDQSGLTSGQLSQIRFSVGSNLYSAKILNTGEVVPDEGTLTPGPTNSWISSTSGNWDDATSWSLGILPNSSQSVLITNSGWKAVAINTSTPLIFPGAMTVSNLTIRGSTNTENTLFLDNAGTVIPLTVLNGLTVADSAQLLNLNSALVVQGGTFDVTNSQINQDGGFINTTNAPMALNDSVYNLTNGDFRGGSVSIGYPKSAHFNQYGGSVTISNVSFASFLGGTNYNGYSLYGGTLDLPGGMFLLGEAGGISYLQTGGTNRTTQITLEPDYGGSTPGFTLSGGLLADSGVELRAGYRASIQIQQNGGTHVITNSLVIVGSSPNGFTVDPATYNLNGGTLVAGAIEMDATDGDSVFVQSNATNNVGTFYAHSFGFFSGHNTHVTLESGTLSCSNYTTVDGGGRFDQSGGALGVSNLLDFGGSRNVGYFIYGLYTFTGGTVTASNINMTGEWIIGDGSSNRISNPGFFRLWHTLQIGNAVEQLGRFVLASTATIDFAGSNSQLSFANSSGEVWSNAALLLVSDWNGNFSGGGAEQLKFGTNGSGLTAGQLSQMWFRVGTNLYSAKILGTGEVVPDHMVPPPLASSTQGNNFVLSWLPGSMLQTATNIAGPYTDLSNPGFYSITPPYTNDATGDPQRFFRVRQ